LRLLALVFVPLLVLGVAAVWIVSSAHRTMRAVNARLLLKGIRRVLPRGGGRACRAGIVDGVAVRVDVIAPRPEKSGDWQIVSASRNHARVFEGLDIPAPDPEPSGVPPALEASEADEAARSALAELPDTTAELERKDDVVEVREASMLDAVVGERMVEIACACVRGVAPPPAASLRRTPGWGYTAFIALLLSAPIAFGVESMAVVHSETMRSVVGRVCDPGDPVVVTWERNGANVDCRAPTGESYGCLALAAAGFDLTFPATFVVVGAVLVLRRRRRRT